MNSNNYNNFDLEIYKILGKYKVKARSFAGEATHTFSLPFTKEEVKDFLTKINDSIINHTLESNLIKNFGKKLFNTIFQNDVRALLKGSVDLSDTKEGKGLRVRLHLQEVPELASLPWEYLYYPTINQFFGLNRQNPIVRYLDIPKVIPSLNIILPLRILVVISNPANLGQLDVDNEKLKLQNALTDLENKGLVEIKFLEIATVSETQKTLRKSEYHIFHFIGHGSFDEINHQGLLAFENERNLVDYVNAEQLAAILINHKSLRLVVLNSCKGAITSIINPFAGTAATLVQQGIPSVVAMQFIISDMAAISFASVFYGAIADGLPVDTAVTEARVAIFAEEETVEWGTPVLYMRSSDGSLFKLKKEIELPKKPFYRYRWFKYLLTTLIFSLIAILILFKFPKYTIIDLDIFAKQTSFSLPAELAQGEEVSLLNSAIWSKNIHVKKVQPIELMVDTIFAPIESTGIQNPLTIFPNSLFGRVTFSSFDEISLQDVISDSASNVNIKLEDEYLSLEINNSSNDPYQDLSLGEIVTVSIRECRVTDDENNDLTRLFSNPVTLKLHDLSMAITIIGVKGDLITILENVEEATDESIQFIFKRLVKDLDFNKTIFQNLRPIRQSTIDSIYVKRRFPFENIGFKSGGIGELEIIAKPNKFMIYELSQDKNLLKVSAQGRLKSLKIGRGESMREFVPGYLSTITQHPEISTFIAFLGWIITLLMPYLYRRIFKNNRSKHVQN